MGTKSSAGASSRPGAAVHSRRMGNFAKHIPPRSNDPRMNRQRERSVPLRGRLNKEAATCCIARFLVLVAENSKLPVITYVASSGGQPGEALTVISTMNGIGTPITTFCPGNVTGPAIAIAAHGLKGFRAAAPAAHFSFGEFEFNGATRDADGNDSLLAIFAEGLARDTGKSTAQIIEWVRTGAEFNAEEAIENGLIDVISTTPTVPKPA